MIDVGDHMRSVCVCDYQLSASCTVYLLWSLCRHLAGVQGVAGVLEDLTGATSLVLFPTQTADKEQLGGALSEGRFGLFSQDVTVPLLTLQSKGMDDKKTIRGNTKLGEDTSSSYLWFKLKKTSGSWDRREVLTFILSGVSFISSRFSMLCLLLILGLAPKTHKQSEQLEYQLHC